MKLPAGNSHSINRSGSAPGGEGRSLEQYRQLVEDSLGLICVHDLEGRVQLINPAAAHRLGYQPAEIVGRSLEEFLPPSARRQFADYLRRIAREPAVSGQIELLTREGAKRTWMYRNARYEEAGKPPYVLAHALDITEQKRAEKALKELQKDLERRVRERTAELEKAKARLEKMEAVGRLAGAVAHDFNNLLVGLLGYTELLLANLDPTHPAQGLAEKILAPSERTASLTRQLLAFSRKQVLAPAVMNLNDTVPETEKMLRRLIGEDIELTSDLDPGLGNVKADPTQLTQALLNLAINARDAMPRGGELRLKTANVELPRALPIRHDLVPAGRYVLLTVSDSGAGMNEEVLEHLFEPFFTTKQPGQGTGLGLAMVYGVVKQSGGYIVTESQRNLGTRFMIYLPRVDDAVEEPLALPANSLPPLRWETILLAEDDQGVLEPVRQHLEMAGYKVLAARTPAEAAALAERFAKPIHLLLTDVVMPEMSGPELAERVGRLRPHTQVLYLSGYTGDTLLKRGVPQKNTVFLQKPFRRETLLDAVSRALAAARGDSISPTLL